MSIISIGDVLADRELLDARFTCDLRQCAGQCCIEGELGAPLSEEEAVQLTSPPEELLRMLPEKNRKYLVSNILLADDPAALKNTFDDLIKNGTDIIITTGGTGIGSHDITVDTIQPLLDKELPGIMDLIRIKYGMKHPAALISRSIAGLKGKTLVFTLPGSVKAVEEYMTEILKNLQHLMFMLYDLDTH